MTLEVEWKYYLRNLFIWEEFPNAVWCNNEETIILVDVVNVDF